MIVLGYVTEDPTNMFLRVVAAVLYLVESEALLFNFSYKKRTEMPGCILARLLILMVAKIAPAEFT
jgi:hypothetical protein